MCRCSLAMVQFGEHLAQLVGVHSILSGNALFKSAALKVLLKCGRGNHG